MAADYEAEKVEFSKCTDVACRVRSQGRYVNRLAELTGAVKNGDQCGKFKKGKHGDVVYMYFRYLTIEFRNSSKKNAVKERRHCKLS